LCAHHRKPHIRAAERRRGVRFIEFELRPLAAVRKELDEEYKVSIAPPARRPPTQPFQQIRALTFLNNWSQGIFVSAYREATSIETICSDAMIFAIRRANSVSIP
jgi:hypothetical protein